MRHRIRERADVDYQVPRSNSSWPDHQLRTLVTAGMIAWLRPTSVLDPACGDGSLVLAAGQLAPIRSVDFVDVSAPSIEALQEQIHVAGWDSSFWTATAGDAGMFLDRAARDGGAQWDAVILTEFLEHVPDPDEILRQARRVGTHLVASSPLVVNPHDDDSNPEHLWAFDNAGYYELLTGAGWTPRVYQNLMFHNGFYDFQIWVCA